LWVAVMNLPGLVIYLILRPSSTLVEAYERSLEEESLLQDIESRLACPTCLTQLKRQCQHCSKVLLLRWNVCPYCAHEVPGATALPAGDGRHTEEAAPARRLARSGSGVRERPLESELTVQPELARERR